MSGFFQLPNRVSCDPRLSDRAKLLYGAVMTVRAVFGPGGTTNKRLAIQCGWSSEDKVRRVLVELESLGYARRVESGAPGHIREGVELVEVVPGHPYDPPQICGNPPSDLRAYPPQGCGPPLPQI